ncbi:MAG: hypothetical protein SWY16_23135 [Cyanobacteriota bacterium]|nr:hypothetical protein [Cyanobacteriota bacterium]
MIEGDGGDKGDEGDEGDEGDKGESQYLTFPISHVRVCALSLFPIPYSLHLGDRQLANSAIMVSWRSVAIQSPIF